jgi:prepilin-type N-terminal cleavage/methylation domain-containing protein
MPKGKAFTLIEIMVVVSIIALIAGGLALINFLRVRENTQRVLCIENRRVIEHAEIKYLAQEKRHSASFQDLVDAGYLNHLLTCKSEGIYAWMPFPENGHRYQTIVGCSVHGAGETPGGLEGMEFFIGGLRIRQDNQGNDYVQEYASSGLYRSGYLPVEAGLSYRLDAGAWDSWENYPRQPRVYFFDQNENYISYGAAFGVFQAPPQAKFLRVRIGVAEGETPGSLRVVEVE